MAKQIAGLCFLEGTFDRLTFYKMAGDYYVRTKSSLTGERVKTSPEFQLTMVYANLLVRASKIGSVIYGALPKGWRQFWMYRSFTGEAFTLLKENPYTEEEVTAMLWETYVAYWEKWEAANANNPALQTIHQERPKRVRKKRVYSLESLLRMKDRYGKPKFKDPKAEERKRVEREKSKAWLAEVLADEALAAEVFDEDACRAVREVQEMLDVGGSRHYAIKEPQRPLWEALREKGFTKLVSLMLSFLIFCNYVFR